MNLKNDLKDKKPVFGLDVNLKKLRADKLSRVYISSNCSSKDIVKSLASASKIELVELNENSKELGVLCKKPFAVSVVGFE